MENLKIYILFLTLVLFLLGGHPEPSGFSDYPNSLDAYLAATERLKDGTAVALYEEDSRIYLLIWKIGEGIFVNMQFKGGRYAFDYRLTLRGGEWRTLVRNGPSDKNPIHLRLTPLGPFVRLGQKDARWLNWLIRNGDEIVLGEFLV